MIQNPVLTGFHPDPAMCYINGTFYMANSTFEYYPGVTLTKSKDLANWERLGYPLKHNKHINFIGTPANCGIWAPCLTHDSSRGRTYLVYTHVHSFNEQNDAHNYITFTDDVESDDWSEPVYINSSGFDPSLFHDTDGRKYFVNMEWDYRKEGGDPKFTGIIVTELDAETLAPISEPVKVFKGTERGLVEGPHIYKRGEYYYLFSAEGGTVYEHAESVCRSKNIYGPYELMPESPYLVTTIDAPDSYLQKTGHGSMCQDDNGRWWFAFLCGRPLENTQYCPLGRETSITEVEWINDWPRIKGGGTVPNKEFDGYGEQKPLHTIDYPFTDKNFLLDFQSLRRPAEYKILDNGDLRLFGKDYIMSTIFQNMLITRQRHYCFEVDTCITNENKNFKVMGGLTYRYNEANQYYLRFAYNEEVGKNTLGIISVKAGQQEMPFGDNEIAVDSDTVHLKLVVKNHTGKFYYSIDGVNYTEIDYTIDVTVLSDEYHELGFTGAMVGIMAQDLQYNRQHCDFKYFKYKEI